LDEQRAVPWAASWAGSKEVLLVALRAVKKAAMKAVSRAAPLAVLSAASMAGM
jgi:hypothetical protein